MLPDLRGGLNLQLAGGHRQLDKLKFVPVYVRFAGGSSPGLDALRKKGALAWPNPQDVEAFKEVFAIAAPALVSSPQPSLALFSEVGTPGVAPTVPEPTPAIEVPSEPEPKPVDAHVDEPFEPTPEPTPSAALAPEASPGAASPIAPTPSTPADTLFAAARGVIQLLLKSPMSDAKVAAALDVSTAQAKAWLQRLVNEGLIEKRSKPLRYAVASQAKLLDREVHNNRLQRTADSRYR